MNEKIKEFLKKNWAIVVAFGTAVIGSVGFIFHRLPRRSSQRGDELRNTVDELADGLAEAGDSISHLRDDNRDNIDAIGQQRDTISKLREGHQSVADTTDEIGASIRRLKQLIEAERERVASNES